MQIRHKISFLLLTIAFLSLISCDHKKQKGTRVSDDSLTVTLRVLRDSLDHAWEVMIADDDEKISFMRRLLMEVSYAGSYDKVRHEELIAMVDRLKRLRYDRSSMQSSRLIDEYDSATNEVSRMVIEFAYQSPKYDQSDLMKELVNDITDKNSMVLLYRVHYDKFAEEINALLIQHEDRLDSGAGLLPLFKLPPEAI